MERWAGKTAIVTGAASGIGEATTAALLQHRVNVIAVDINFEGLKTAATKWDTFVNGGKYYLKHCDVCNDTDVDNVCAFAESLGGVNIMVNNAGFIEFTRVIDSDWETMDKMLKVFVLATAAFMTKATHSMSKQNTEGHIINVNSVAGINIPTHPTLLKEHAKSFNIYPACKFGSIALTEIVRRELAAMDAKIRVTSICPGMVDTNIAAKEEALHNSMIPLPKLKSEDIADTIICALSTRPEVELSEIIVRYRNEID